MKPETFTDWLIYIESLMGESIKLGLSRVGMVAERLAVLPMGASVVTVGGTNGKGSTVCAIEGLLLSQSKRVGCYTSPHLFHYCERVRIDGKSVSEDLMCQAFSAVEQARGDVGLTYFEFGTLAALWVFAQSDLDVVVLEVGLGGRLDAVNLVDADVAVVTSIDLDHMDWLGETREEIAVEKAGILRSGQAVVCGERMVPESFESVVGAQGCVGYFLGQAFDVTRDGDTWRWGYGDFVVDGLPVTSLVIDNLACALMAVTLLLGESVVQTLDCGAVFSRLVLPGRFQTVEVDERLMVFDVGHNPAAAVRLAQSLDDLPCDGRRLAVVGMLAEKDMVETLRPLNGVISHWFLGELDTSRSASCEQLEGVKGQLGLSADVCADFDEAYRKAMEYSHPGDQVVVFGSFYAVAAGLCLQDGLMAVE